jgi:hypothetical protein
MITDIGDLQMEIQLMVGGGKLLVHLGMGFETAGQGHDLIETDLNEGIQVGKQGEEEAVLIDSKVAFLLG